MKRNIIKALVVATLMTPLPGSAADLLPVQGMEGEIRLGPSFALDGSPGYNHTGHMGIGFGLELRQNIESSPWDVGILFDMTDTRHTYRKINDSSVSKVDNWVNSIAGIVDYNFRQGRTINPFAGIGVGLGFYNQDGSPFETCSSGNTAVFIPRIGVELAHHFRIAASCHIIRRGFNTAELSIGFVIGGRPRKLKSLQP